jgi:hypothetical protein
MIQALDQKICSIMDNEDYMLIEAKNGEDYFKYVDKYELDLSGYFKNLKPASDDEMDFPSLKS